MNEADAGPSRRTEVIEQAEFRNHPGRLEGQALARALEARALRAHPPLTRPDRGRGLENAPAPVTAPGRPGLRLQPAPRETRQRGRRS